MPGIGVVVNPHAKGNRSESSDRERRMADILGSDGTVRVTPTLDAVDQVAHEFVDRNVDILAICGGDGSDHCTLTAFHRVYAGRPLPLLLPLRAGTINYIADATAGRRGTPEQVLARVVRDYRRGHTHVTTERDVLRVTAGTSVELGFLLSFGTTVNFLRAYYALDRQGPWPATKLLSKMMASAVFGTHISRGGKRAGFMAAPVSGPTARTSIVITSPTVNPAVLANGPRSSITVAKTADAIMRDSSFAADHGPWRSSA